MHPAIAYLLKMLLCSAILLGYYWAALRNERFHQWNRFYLLSALFLSVVIPFINIPLLMQEEPTVVVTMVAALPWNKVVVAAPADIWTWKNLAILSIAGVSCIMLIHLLASVLRMVKMYKSQPHTYFKEVSVVITEEQSAPFSFFKWLFWRSDIDPDTVHGQRILQHELTHINEKHSADKLFTELLLIVFWMNPFFWIMRKELFAIHEFLADRKAIESQDGAAFAAMILQALHHAPTPALSNPFFTSHLKRRLIMITTSPAPRYSYLRRISGLILMVFTGIILVLSIDNAMAQKAPPPPPKKNVSPPPPPAPVAPPDGQWTVLPDSIKSAEVIDKKGHCYIKYEMKDGRKFTYELNQAQRKGYYIPPPSPKSPVSPTSGVSPVSPISSISEMDNLKGFWNSEKPPLFIYAGLEITEAQVKQIDPKRIASIDVLKGESALAIFGDKGKNGVINIRAKDEDVRVVKGYSTKKTNEPPVASNGPGEVVVVGFSAKANTSPTNKEPIVFNGEKIPAVVVLDGKRISSSELNTISPDAIASMNVLKGEKAVAKYGAEASEGAIEITTKSTSETFDKVFTKTEQMPAFPGGSDAWRKHLERNLQYPNKAQENGTMGAVKVQFVVDTEGNISDVKAVNDPGDGLAEEAVRIIKTGPKWEPAVQNGHKVVARTFQTITFRLE